MIYLKMYRLLVISLVLFVTFFINVTNARSKSPLMDDEGAIIRPRNKAAECIFGKQIKELGSTWVPDLGVPIGVLYCMKCECVPFQRKRKIVAKVQCRSIKNECPEPSCENPEVLPGRCCKTCPGDLNSPDVIQDVVPQNIESDERSMKHYAALLTGRSSLILRNDDMKPILSENKNNVIATGRFTFQKRNFYYSFYVSDKAARPQSLQFVNHEGTILEEQTLSETGGHVNSAYQNDTRKVCGVWRRFPKEYRKLLKEQKMYVVLVWGGKDQEFTLSGQIMKYVALGTELFSSLLEPAPGTNPSLMAGAGGTAIVSASTTISPSIHVAIVFNGVFLPNETSNVPINVTLALDGKQIILEEKRRVIKPAHELNLIEISSPLSSSDLRQLTRGRLVLSVTSVSNPQAMHLTGKLITKATCELFQTALTSSSPSTNPYGTSGLAWLYLNHEGALVFRVQIDGLRSDHVSITLTDMTTKRRTDVEDLTPSFRNGWANGTIDKLGPKVLEPLYSGNLAVNVATQNESSLIRGRLTAHLVSEARDASAPVLLKREGVTLSSSIVGLAWINIDLDCHIHYDISLSGFGSSEKHLSLYMEMFPMLAPGAPYIEKILETDIHGNQVEGSPIESLTREELRRLNAGVTFIKIKDKHTKNTLLAATLKQVRVPQKCFPYSLNNDLPSLDTDIPQNTACLHEDRFYQEEAQWTSTSDPCTMCFCQNGDAKCDTTPCPELKCAEGTKVKVPGECCPICAIYKTSQESNISVPKGCTFGGKFYIAGSKFHPFLVPNGFDLCTECYCDPILLEVKCTRIGNEKTCCTKCSTTQQAQIDSENGTYVSDNSHVEQPLNGIQKKVTPHKKPVEKAAGDCANLADPLYPHKNGSKYHPHIASLGEYKCVTCRCENGNTYCERQGCTKAMCHKLAKRRKNPTDTTTDVSDICCKPQQCNKYFRRHNRQHNKS